MGKFSEKAAPYLASGWPVFPLRPATNKYFAKENPDQPGGFYWATTDPDKIAEWDRRWPDANIALRTGAASGVVVVDLDFGKSEARASVETLAQSGFIFPPTPGWAQTPSGGEHLYYRYVGPLSCSASKLGNKIGIKKSGIDIRADGRLAILPPTFVAAKGVYAWLSEPFGETLPPLPRWIMDQLREKPVETTPYASSPTSGVGIAAWRLQLLASKRAGERNATLFRMAAQAADWGHSPSEIERSFLQAALDCGLNANEATATIQSAVRSHNRRPIKWR